ncbi:divergent polysaccharide deacetylase family protein [Roseibacterium beibuensis]|uniref:Divergent polysaccharide deacetylase family protein n=1 Tax=[Roseibacterium] beibuensis TaxID=1193142 RepID=A0ABP9L3A1_9RHOB|nr:polysaccharide deacteylase family 2 protein [Roseibacterium beibuensis]MCS6621609.1 divergent polysaccharide deacetylase family protein [Roseibacterium beibuensis]
MGRGIFLGVIWGALVALIVSVAVSLSTPLPERGLRMATAPAPEVESVSPTALGTGAGQGDAPAEDEASPDEAEADAAPPETAPEPAEAPAPEPAPTPEPGSDQPDASGPATEIPLPSGSEFNRPPPEEEAALPTTDEAPAAAAPRALPAPDGTSPQALDTAPAPQPDIATVPTAPAPGALATLDLAPPSMGAGDAASPARPQPTVLPSQGTEAAPIPSTRTAPLPQVVPPEPDAAVEADAAPEAVTEPAPVTEEAAAVDPAPTTPEGPVADEEAPASPEPVIDPDAPLPPVRRLVQPEGSAPVGLVTEDDLSTPSVIPTAPAPAVPQPPAATADPAPQADAPQEDGFASDAPVQPRRLRPGESGTLPQITASVPEASEPAADEDAAAPEPEAEAATGALAAYSVPFDSSETRPLIAVILIDDPEAGLDIPTLTRFSFPVAFAIDPLRPDAAMRAAAFREAGFEVLMLGTAVPADATAQDAEVALSAASEAVPEAIAILDTPDNRIQSNRPALDAVVGRAGAAGQGLLAFPRGLNAAEQSALRVDVPAATLFRLLDDENQRATVITRYLGRAEFAAQQEGAVVVAGRTRPDTVTALFSWALSGRDEGVAVAPVSEVLRRSVQD